MGTGKKILFGGVLDVIFLMVLLKIFQLPVEKWTWNAVELAYTHIFASTVLAIASTVGAQIQGWLGWLD